MARTRHQKPQQPKPHHGKGSGRQLLVNFCTPWIIATLLVAIFDGQLVASAGVDALSNSISLNGNGNRLQQQELPGIEAATAEKQLSHHQNNDDNANDDNQNDDDEADVSIGGEQLNYVMVSKYLCKLDQLGLTVVVVVFILYAIYHKVP